MLPAENWAGHFPSPQCTFGRIIARERRGNLESIPDLPAVPLHKLARGFGLLVVITSPN